MEIKKYQLTKINNPNTFNRICNEVKKIDTVFNATIDRTTRILIVELNAPTTSIDSYYKKIESSLLKAVHVYERQAAIKSIDNVEVFRKVLYLRGLDCAYCGSRVENIAKREFNHQKIIVDYPTARFIIETTDKELVAHLEERLTEVAHKVDERIIVQSAEKGKPIEIELANQFKKPAIVIFLAGILFYTVGILLDSEFASGVITNPLSITFIIIGYVMIGNQVLIRFLKSVFKGRFLDENFLMTVASICAIVIQKYTEAGLILVLYQIGDYLSNLAVNRSRKSIASLLQFDVQNVKLRIEDEIQEVAVEGIIPDDVIVINAGEMIPVDGKICKGKTVLDMKNITGESLLRDASMGDEVLSGSLNIGSQIELRVTHTYNNSMMTKIMDLVENSTANKAKTENFISKFARYYTPTIVVMALIIFIFGLIQILVNNSGDWIGLLNLVANFMIIACPCALVISIPLCFFISIGVASKRGILIRGSNYLEAFYHVDKIVFDKTGTLTKGNFSIIDIVPLEKYSFTDILRYFLYTEYYSEHPIGKSIVDNYGRDQFFPEIISDFKPLRGGARAIVNGSKILIANAKLATKEKLEFPEVDNPNMIIYVFRENLCIGYVIIGDSIRDEAFNTMAKLREYGIGSIYMLTGDSHLIADDVANKLQIDEVYSELLPDEKVDYMDKIKASVVKKNGTVCFVGDGVNDAPVISTADVGIAMADTASDVTISISDIVIMSSDLSKLVDLAKLSKSTRNKIIFNISFTLAVKFIILLASLALSSFDYMPLWLSIFADVGVSLIAVSNALLLFGTFKKDNKVKQNDK